MGTAEGPHEGLALLRPLEGDERLGHRLDAAKGHLLERVGHVTEAVRAYHRAAKATLSIAERDYLLLRAALLRESR